MHQMLGSQLKIYTLHTHLQNLFPLSTAYKLSEIGAKKCSGVKGSMLKASESFVCISSSAANKARTSMDNSVDANIDSLPVFKVL